MYVRLKSGILEEFEGTSLNYTKTENGVMYYIRIINPTAKEFGEAGYFETSEDYDVGLCTKARDAI